jgi:hypothetical protein
MIPSLGKIGLLIALAFFVVLGQASAQLPCTNEQAYQRRGKLELDRREQSDLDRRSRVSPEPAVLHKIDRTIALLQQALPELQGAEGKFWHVIRDPSPNSHVLRFEVQVAIFAYYCVSKGYAPGMTGTIRPEEETGAWITIDFNSLGWLVEERSSLGKELRTPKGETMFYLPREGGELQGHRLFLPDKYGSVSDVIVLTPPDRFPFKPVTREEFLQARENLYQSYINKLPPSQSGDYRYGLEQISQLHATQSPMELQQQAVVRDPNQTPSRGKVFVTEAERGLRLVTIDRSYIDPTLPRTAVQLITVHWSHDESPVKNELIRQFESNFDFAALQRLLDR